MPDHVQLELWEPYDPQVNDYVIWDQGEYGIDEGWAVSYTHLTLPTILLV